MTTTELDKRLEKTVKYLCHTLNVLPSAYISLDTTKLLLAYFGISGLDVLDRLNKLPFDKQIIIDWIYFHQIKTHLYGIDPGICGFRGSCSLVTEKDQNENVCKQNHDFDCSHVTMTFSALNCLLTLGDDLSRIDKKAIITSLKQLQLPDGSFTATFDGCENDVRFVYSACCISFIFNDWSGVNKENACNFIRSCLTYEGAFGQNPGAEAHGGSTFCAVASLNLMEKLDILSQDETENLILWCLNRQTTGFNGRVNKPFDSCYSFWIGSTLKILDALKYINYTENINYLFETNEERSGGFSKWPSCAPDPLHSFMGLCGLSLVQHSTLKPIHPALVITMQAYEHLKELHKKWST